MNRFFKIYVIALLFLLPSISWSQADQDLVTVADEMYKFGGVRDALEIYKQASELNSKNSYANFMAGRCYLETIHKVKSLPYLLAAYELDHHIAFNILFLIASAYHLDYKFDDAIVYYEKYRTKLLNERENEIFKSKEEIKKIDRRIEECNNGKYYVSNPVLVSIENMGKTVNSPYGEYAPVISADQSLMFFTARKKGSTGGNKANDNEFFEDIYYSESKDGEWTEAVNIGTPVNTALHEASIGLSHDGKILFIYKDDNKNTGDIFLCTRDAKGKWTNMTSIGKEINSEYIENSVTITKDGKQLYFASNRPGGVGGMDIYMSRKLKNGKWGVPENLGSTINTTYDDESPFIHADGKTLYFSSKGHKGMGGFDIYKSIYDSTQNKWSSPENLGYPVNSTDEDIYFVISGDNNYGYYSSVKDEGEEGVGNLDLFRILFNVKPQEIDTLSKDSLTVGNAHSVVLDLFFQSKDDKQPVDAKFEITDMHTHAIITDGVAKNGKYSISFNDKHQKEVMVSVSKEGYVYKKEQLIIPGAIDKRTEISRVISLSKIEIGSRFILKNVYFDFDKASLTANSFTELDKLVNFLRLNPNVKIAVNGHTDSQGSKAYNIDLSLKRSQAIVDYLTTKGIANERLSPKGFGKSMPLASNDDEQEGRELNRRTEIVILNK